jgi:uncharacterized protein YndB with AHSA1/START domain
MRERHFSQEVLSPVVKSVHVPLTIEAAFRLFTEGFGRWWPLLTHSVGEEDAETCILEGKVGGRIYEVLKDQSQVDWGVVLDWDPPVRLAFTWHPGRTPDTAQQVEVAFNPAAGGARVVLTHTGWERQGERAQSVRENYVTGWDTVLGKYIEFASR